MPGLCSCPPRFRVKSISARKKSAGSSFSTGLHSRHHALQGVRAVLRKADRPRRHCHPLTRLIVALSQELKRLTAQLSRRPSRENSSERALLWMRHRAALSFCISGCPQRQVVANKRSSGWAVRQRQLENLTSGSPPEVAVGKHSATTWATSAMVVGCCLGTWDSMPAVSPRLAVVQATSKRSERGGYGLDRRGSKGEAEIAVRSRACKTFNNITCFVKHVQ